MYIVYILKSLMMDRYYIGHTGDMKDRLMRHNQGRTKSTKPYRPWTIIYTEEKSTKSEAYKRELEIKNYKGGIQLRKLIGRVA